MGHDAVISETLASFDIVGESENESPAAIPPRKRRLSAVKDNGKVGRSRFAGNICEEHPEWEDDDGTISVAIPGDFPCAKFSGLPGKGRGIKQPSIGQVLRATTLEFVRPLMLIGMLVGGLYGFQHVVLHGNGGFHLLRPTSVVQKSTGGMPNSSQHPTPSTIRPSSGSNPHSRVSNRPSLPANPAVKK